MIRRLLRRAWCAFRGHELCVYAEEARWWWCRCGVRGESAEERLFGGLWGDPDA